MDAHLVIDGKAMKLKSGEVKVILDDFCADVDTFITDKDPVGSCDEFSHHILGFPAEGAITRFIIGT